MRTIARLAAATMLAALPLTAAAQTATTQTPTPMAQLADGQPWQTVGPDGRALQMTFLPDGTVRLRAGWMRMGARWTPTDSGFCMTGGPGGERCLALTPQEGGWLGRAEDGSVMVFRR